MLLSHSLSHTLTTRGSDVASLIGLRSGLGGGSMMDRWMDGGVNNIPIVFLKKRGKKKDLTCTLKGNW